MGLKTDGEKMAVPQIPQKLQDQLARFEQMKAQLQIVITQRTEMEARKKDIDNALGALSRRTEGDVYRRVGDLLIKVEDTEKLEGEMKGELEVLTVRLTSILKQEEQLKKMYESLGTELNDALKGFQ